MCLSPHGPLFVESLVPNPMKESQVLQSFSLLPRIPILALGQPQYALKPSLLQWSCKVSFEPSSAFHLLPPSDVARNCPSAMSEYSESAFLLIEIKLVVSCPGIFMPRQILENDMFQQVGSLASCMSKPVFPPSVLWVFLLLRRLESQWKVSYVEKWEAGTFKFAHSSPQHYSA